MTVSLIVALFGFNPASVLTLILSTMQPAKAIATPTNVTQDGRFFSSIQDINGTNITYATVIVRVSIRNSCVLQIGYFLS